MKTILLLKRIDLTVQLFALIIPALLACVNSDIKYLYMCYGTVGVVQFVSCVVHYAAYDEYYHHKDRTSYHYAFSVVMVLGLLALVFQTVFLLMAGVMLVLFTPFMAIAYLRLSYLETRFMKGLMSREQFTRI